MVCIFEMVQFHEVWFGRYSSSGRGPKRLSFGEGDVAQGNVSNLLRTVPASKIQASAVHAPELYP